MGGWRGEIDLWMGEPAVWSQCDSPGHINPCTPLLATGAGRTPGVDESTRTDARTQTRARRDQPIKCWADRHKQVKCSGNNLQALSGTKAI